jgi:hypothetical protein
VAQNFYFHHLNKENKEMKQPEPKQVIPAAFTFIEHDPEGGLWVHWFLLPEITGLEPNQLWALILHASQPQDKVDCIARLRTTDEFCRIQSQSFPPFSEYKYFLIPYELAKTVLDRLSKG